jgi:murein DD-endopeptidase MepM/ murein hydrolase activator NlpD
MAKRRESPEPVYPLPLFQPGLLRQRPAATAPAVSATGTRHVGRVTDPLARDDGESEPELTLTEPSAEGEAPTSAQRDVPHPVEVADIPEKSEPAGRPEAEQDVSDVTDEPEVDGQGDTEGIHPVRARLLARAAAAKQARGRAGGRAGPGDVGAASGMDSELDGLGSAPAPSAPSPGAMPASLRPSGPLSPNMVALFGTLLGLALVASIIALVMRVQPTTGAETEAAPTASAAVTAVATVEKPKRVKIPGPWRIEDESGDTKLKILRGKIGADPFLRAIQDAGLEKKEAYRVFNALKDLRNLDRCDRSDAFLALVDRASSRVKAFEYVVSKEEVYQARENDKGELAAKKLDFKIERGQVEGAFVVDGGDLDAAAERAGLEKGISSVLARALDGHMSLDELKRGDVLRIVAQEVTVLGEFSRYAGIEALEIRRADDGGQPYRLYYFRGQKERGYYDDKGRAPYEGGWRKPIKDAPITSHFNPKRFHPVLKKIMPHTGTDFGASTGTPVGASSYGTVSFVGPAGPSGNLVKIDHPGGIETGYAHLSRFADGLKVGDKVKRLQIIGYVGSTGRSTGPHLHFTAKRDGKFFDAETLNLDGMRVVAKEERDAFAQVKQKYDGLIDAVRLPEALPPEATAAAPASAAPEEEPGPKDDSFAAGGPESPSAAPEEAPAAPKPAGGSVQNPVYLTDKELMKAQSADDDGEVSE